MTRKLQLLTLTIALACAAAHAQDVVFADGFENGLDAWRCRWPDKQALTVSGERAHAGEKSAYSGRPGNTMVMEHAFRSPLSGRVEVRFYDDLAPGKQQIATVGGSDEGAILAIIVRDGKTYEYRIGKTYTATAVPRREGWRLFAWECDGLTTSAFIDGVKVAETADLPLVHRLCLGSFWNDSTGWYDDVKVISRPPSRALPVVEAEGIASEYAGGMPGIQLERKKGASGEAIKNWDRVGHSLTWYLGTVGAGDYQLLLKHAGSGPATRTGEWQGQALRIEFPDTGGWDQWQYQTVPVAVAQPVGRLHLVNAGGSRNLDWIALIPNDVDAQAYGPLLDQWLAGRERRATAWTMTRRAAQSVGIIPPDVALAGPIPPELPSLPELKRIVGGGTDGLAALRQQVLDREADRLKGAFDVPNWGLDGRESDLTRELYSRLVRYLKLTQPRFRDWPYLADCRYHKREGSQEWDVRQNATVALGYATIVRGPYDEAVGGVSRAELQSELVRLLRTISVTHHANFLPTSDGKEWGNHWQSAYWAAIAGQAAWLVWEDLPSDVKIMVARMVEHAANRFNTRPPDSGYLLDTKAEENAWNSEAIALAACMFPNHPNSELWHERAKVYMVNAFARQADGTSDRMVDGKPLKDRITAVTLHDDFTLENHHRVHPDYLSCSSLNLRNALLYRAAGLPIPESMSHGARETYAVFKKLTAINGSCFYVNGQDWWPHRHDVPLLLSTFCSVLYGDPEGAFLERANLAFFARMHARFDDGSAWHPREYNYANAEEEVVLRYAELYLLHRMFGDGAEPVSREEFLASRAGARIFERGGFAIHSAGRKYASFTWRNGVMGLVFVDDDTWLTAPYERGLVGSLAVKGRRDDTPKALRQSVRQLGDGFAAVAEVSRCQGAVRQWVAMVSLPGRPVLYLERLSAAEDITVDSVRTGALGILNENAPGINPNQRMLRMATGERRVVGMSEEPASEFSMDGGWVNVDDRLGVVTSCRNGFRYLDENRYRRSRLREVLSACVADEIGPVASGSAFAETGVLILPGATAAETEAEALKTAVDGPVIGARLGDGTVVLANLSGDSAAGELLGVPYELKPLEALVVGLAQ